MTQLALAVTAEGASGWAEPALARTGRRAFRAEAWRGPTAYRDLRADWLELAERQQGAIPFQTPDLLEVWARHFAQRPDALVTVVVRRPDGGAVLIWPLVIEATAGVRVARGAGAPVGQYDEILLDPSCNAVEAFAAARGELRRAAKPDLVVLERVRADGPLRTLLGDLAPMEPPEGAPYADLSGGFEPFMATLKTRVSRQQRKRVRRFEQEGTIDFAVASDAEQAQAWLAEAIELKRQWLRSTGRFSRAFTKCATVNTLADWAGALARPGAAPRVLVSRLSLDGRTAAIEMGVCHRGVYHLYLGAFAPELGKFGPGNVLTEKLLGWCAENGITRYDMLAPRSRNKAEWQTAETEVFDFALPLTWRGRAYADLVLRRLLPGMRRAFYALPDTLRARVAGVALHGLGGLRADVTTKETAADND